MKHILSLVLLSFLSVSMFGQEVHVSIDTNAILIGEQVKVNIDYQFPSDKQGYIPFLPDSPCYYHFIFTNLQYYSRTIHPALTYTGNTGTDHRLVEKRRKTSHITYLSTNSIPLSPIVIILFLYSAPTAFLKTFLLTPKRA